LIKKELAVGYAERSEESRINRVSQEASLRSGDRWNHQKADGLDTTEYSVLNTGITGCRQRS
jgi:hypothetical protein